MKKIDELKREMVRGDYQIIHKMTKVPVDTITAFFNGYRNADTPVGEKVRKAAQKVIDSRKALLNDSSDEEPELEFSKEVA
jgi:IMP dehydrogenase/GMP reductase